MQAILIAMKLFNLEIFYMIRLFIDANIAKATIMEIDFYIEREYFETAKEKIFVPSWQFTGSKDMVKFTGDVQPLTLLENYLNEPLL